VSMRRGSTLALVLWTLVLLGGISLTLTGRSRQAVAVASNARADLVARYAAESGVLLAVRAIEDSLGVIVDSTERMTFLNELATRPVMPEAQSLPQPGSKLQVVVEDVNAKLDINFADEDALFDLLRHFGDDAAARRTARAIRAHIGSGVTPDLPGESFPNGPLSAARFLTSLDELLAMRDVDHQLLSRAAPYLTVDGDGSTNRVTAALPVMRAARGGLVAAPTRLLVISRGWLEGTALTHEIQAAYAIQGNDLALVRWRETQR
jgi:type II secretory pathway component PulK